MHVSKSFLYTANFWFYCIVLKIMVSHLNELQKSFEINVIKIFLKINRKLENQKCSFFVNVWMYNNLFILNSFNGNCYWPFLCYCISENNSLWSGYEEQLWVHAMKPLLLLTLPTSTSTFMSEWVSESLISFWLPFWIMLFITR